MAHRALVTDRSATRRRGGRAARLSGRRREPADPPARSRLVHEGLRAPPAPDKVLVVACGALAHEILALIRVDGLDHLHLHCLPAILHNTPDAIPGAVADALDRLPHVRAFVAYADCGTGGRLAALCAARGVEMIAGPHCYAFYEGVDAFAARTGGGADMRTFYVTDFLARQFDAFVTGPLGLDRHPELREVYFGRYDTMLHQAQVDDPALERVARRHAAALGLRYERRMTGYGDLRGALAGLRPIDPDRPGPLARGPS